jgi:hypothetical protein
VEDAGDEEAGENEEEVDAGPPGVDEAEEFAEAGEGGAEFGEVVIEDNGEDGTTAEAVEGREVGGGNGGRRGITEGDGEGGGGGWLSAGEGHAEDDRLGVGRRWRICAGVR